MLVVAAVAGVLIATGVLQVDKIIAAVNNNKPLAALVIMALFAFKGFSCIPYAVILLGCSLIFDLPVAILINTAGTALCISVSYLVGRFSKELTFDGMLENTRSSSAISETRRKAASPSFLRCTRCIFPWRCRACFSVCCALRICRMWAAPCWRCCRVCCGTPCWARISI